VIHIARLKHPNVIQAEQQLRRDLNRHLRSLGFTITANGIQRPSVNSKESIRLLHRKQRIQKLRETKSFVKRVSPKLLEFFAVDPHFEIFCHD
jgi:hypothetical protein